MNAHQKQAYDKAAGNGRARPVTLFVNSLLLQSLTIQLKMHDEKFVGTRYSDYSGSLKRALDSLLGPVSQQY
jgi:hypothetical protein